MTGGTLGRRYAKAILELAVEQKQLDKVGRDLADVLAAWQSSRELQEVFENPSVGTEARRNILRAMADRMGLSPIVRNTLLFISDRRRLRSLPRIVEAFEALAEAQQDRVRAEVITATEMPEGYFAQLKTALESVTGKEVVLVRKQDPSLIAGVVTKVGDKIFDGSVKNRLRELRDELLAR